MSSEPIDPNEQSLQLSLQLRSSLLALQKELLSFLHDGFERESARQVPPTEWLQVIMGSERYSWLKELTSLITDIDLLTELPQVTQEQASVARAEVERLFFEQDSTSEFSKHYRQVLLTGAPLLLNHGHLRQAVHAIPAAKSPISEKEGHAQRMQWQEEHRLTRKRRS